MDSPKILLLFSDTGGGHRSVAEALAEAMQRRLPTACLSLLDLLHDSTHFPINRAGSNYRFMVQKAPLLWRAVWWLGQSPRRLRFLMEVCRPLVSPARQRLRDESPDLVISVHPLLNHLPLRFLREAGNPAPFVTVVTDLASVHPAWLCSQVSLCAVAGETAAQSALSAGLSAEQVCVLGLPVGSQFRPVEPESKPAWRRKLHLDADEPLILLVAGHGVGLLPEIAEELSAGLSSARMAQIAIICGNDERLRLRLQRSRWPLPVTVEGYVKNMPDWMAAADLILSKAGPSTIAEALAVGLPIVLYGHIAGQEEGNVPFVVDNGAGVYEREPEKIAHMVVEWLRPGNPTLSGMRSRARALGRPRAAEQVLDEVLRLLPVG